MEKTSKNWTVHDKLAAYKRLVELHKKEQDNQAKDIKLLKRQNEHKIADLRADIKQLKEHLVFSKLGNEVGITATFEEDRELKLSFANLNQEEILTELDGKLLDKRKQLDLLRHKTSLAKQALLNQQLELNRVEKEKFESQDTLQQNDERQIYNNRILEIKKNHETTFNVERLLTEMANNCIKDKTYHSAVLDDLKKSLEVQQRCIVRAIEMGQLAREDVANMRESIERLERQIHCNQEHQQATIAMLKDQLAALVERSQYLIPTETNTTMTTDYSQVSESDTVKQMKGLKKLLKRIQNQMSVQKITAILPGVDELVKQKEKLQADRVWVDSELFDVSRKLEHGHLILASTIQETDAKQAVSMAKKGVLQHELGKLSLNQEAAQKDLNDLVNLTVDLRIGATRVWDISKPIIIQGYETQQQEENQMQGSHHLIMTNEKCTQMDKSGLTKMKVSETEREQGLAAIIRRKTLTRLAVSYDEVPAGRVSVYKDYEDEDPTVPTRADIKPESQNILEIAKLKAFKSVRNVLLPSKLAVTW